MKAFISLIIILLLFQTLMLGSLVKIELPEVYTEKWEETRLDKQLVIDPFLLPGKEGFSQNPNYRNDCVPFCYYKSFGSSNNYVQFQVCESRLPRKKIDYYQNTPVYLRNETLLI